MAQAQIDPLIKNRQYEDRIVAFIDILGFRSLINETIKEDNVNEQKLSNLLDALSLIRNEFRKEIEKSNLPYSFVITYFSDSIVFSVLQTNNIGLLSLFEILKRIQIKLIKSGILLRGGVVAGKVIHQGDFVLGPAMNNAYDLESKSALYPRISIDPDIMEMYVEEHEMQSGLFSVKEFDYYKTFEIDFDNTYFINYFSHVLKYLEDGDEKSYFQILRGLIRNGIKRKDIGIRMKYMWMMRKFNQGKPEYVRNMVYGDVDELNQQLEKSII